MEFKEKNVLVFGSGISGVAASRLLLKKDARVILYDGNTSLDAGELERRVLGPEAASDGSGHAADGSTSGGMGRLTVLLGELPEEVRKSLSLVVMSPGVPTDLPVVSQMGDEGIPIWGEVELAHACSKGTVLAITGTNGKTTTTTLLGQMVRNDGRDTFVVGNIGNPYTEIALEMMEDSVAVAEMSSFQLETVHDFHPRVHHAGPLKPPPYDGKLHCRQEKYFQEPDGEGRPGLELRGRGDEGVCQGDAGAGHFFQQQAEAAGGNLSGRRENHVPRA